MRKQDPMSVLKSEPFIIFDTEYTAWEGSKERKWGLTWEEKEIIQIGANRVEYIDNRFVEVDNLLIYVNPVINPELSEYIIRLTGIQQKDIDAQGVDLSEALDVFSKFAGYGSLSIYSWGGDENVIEKNCSIRKIPYTLSAHNFYDIRKIFDGHVKNIEEVCSGEIAEYFGKKIVGHIHNALHDCRSILAGINAISDKM